MENMKKVGPRLLASVKKHKILTIILAISILLLVWWAFVNLTPKPLGDKMEYLGKVDSGGGLFFRDYAPSSTYYYGTDMEPTELTGYFREATYAPIDNFARKHAFFTTTEKDFMFIYLDGYAKQSIPYTSNKKYIVSIQDSEYPIAKKHLKN